MDSSPKPAYRVLLTIAAILLSAAAYFWSYGLQPVWWLMWLAPLPPAAHGSPAPGMGCGLHGFRRLTLGGLDMWRYHRVLLFPVMALVAMSARARNRPGPRCAALSRLLPPRSSLAGGPRLSGRRGRGRIPGEPLTGHVWQYRVHAIAQSSGAPTRRAHRALGHRIRHAAAPRDGRRGTPPARPGTPAHGHGSRRHRRIGPCLRSLPPALHPSRAGNRARRARGV